MAPEEEIVLGGRAAEVLDSAVFLEARKHVQAGIERQMKAVPLSDQTMHTRLILAMQLWDQFEKYFEQIKQTGEIRQFEIHQESERKKRFALWSNG